MAFETTLLDPSTPYTNGLYFVKVMNVTKNTEVTAGLFSSGADTTNQWPGNHTVLTADVEDEIIVTLQGNDETNSDNDMVFLKAESDQPLFAELGGFLEPDGDHVFLNRFASEREDTALPTGAFGALYQNVFPMFGFQPTQNYTGFIPSGDNSVSGWDDTRDFEAVEIRNANAGERWQFGVKFKINSENFNALHIKVHGGHPNATSGASGTIMTVSVPLTVSSVVQNPAASTPGVEPTFPLELLNTENTNNGVHWAKIKNVTKGTQIKSSALGFPMGQRYVFETLEAERGDEIVLTLQLNDAMATGTDEVYAVATPGLGVTSATVGGLLRPDDESITFFNATTGTTPFPSMTVPTPTTNNIVTFPTDTIDTDVGSDYTGYDNLNTLNFPANTKIISVGDADPDERWQVSIAFTIPNSTDLATHAIALATRQGQGAPTFTPHLTFLVNEFRFPIKVMIPPTSSGGTTPLSEGPATDINYRRETKLFLFQDGSKYEIKLDGDFDFSQTFSEKSTSSNTLHNTQHFESSSIVKANPADFEFRVNLLLQNDAQILFDNLLNPRFCDLYFQTSHATFKLDRAVFTNGNFEIGRNSILKLSISGEAAILQRAGDESYTIPGVAVVPSTKRTPFIPGIEISLNSRDISLLIADVSAELQNDIKWVPYETMNQAVKVVARGNAMYPSNFVLNKKIFAGSITKYVATGDEATLLNFDKEAPLRIKVGKTISNTFYGLDFNMASCSFTNRVTPREIYTQNFDWRLTSNADLNGILKYFTLT